MAFLEDLRRWQSTNNYLQDLEGRYGQPGPCYCHKNLVAIRYPGEKTSSTKYRKPSLSGREKDRVAQAMHYYIDKLPEMATFMADKGFGDDMISRAMCWHRAVSFIPKRRRGLGGMTVPSDLYGSRMPVYIS